MHSLHYLEIIGGLVASAVALTLLSVDFHTIKTLILITCYQITKGFTPFPRRVLDSFLLRCLRARNMVNCPWSPRHLLHVGLSDLSCPQANLGLRVVQEGSLVFNTLGALSCHQLSCFRHHQLGHFLYHQLGHFMHHYSFPHHFCSCCFFCHLTFSRLTTFYCFSSLWLFSLDFSHFPHLHHFPPLAFSPLLLHLFLESLPSVIGCLVYSQGH